MKRKDDYVAITIRAAQGAPLADLLTTAPGIVGDHGQKWTKPDKPLYLFRGKLVSTATGKVVVDVTGGNRRALKLLIGQRPSRPSRPATRPCSCTGRVASRPSPPPGSSSWATG